MLNATALFWRLVMPRSLILLAVPLLFGADAAKNVVVINDHELLQGDWKAARGWRNGAPLPKDETDRVGLQFTETKLIVKDHGHDEDATFTLDPQQSPAHIDFEMKNVGMKFQGIYQMDGDFLKLCFSRNGKRPVSFDTKQGADTVLIEMRKVTK
jgi:uncharacterized protein (TIGR03067 family)